MMIDMTNFEKLNEQIENNNLEVMDRVVLIELSKIRENSLNFYAIDEKEVERYAESIKINGLYTPISVYKKGELYIITSGHTRFKAHKKLGKNMIKCIIGQEFESKEEEEIAIIESNRQRDKSKEQKYEEIKRVKNHYQKLKASGNEKYKNININKLTAKAVGMSSETVKKVTSKKENLKSEVLSNEDMFLNDVKKLEKQVKKIMKYEEKVIIDSEFKQIIENLEGYINRKYNQEKLKI